MTEHNTIFYISGRTNSKHNAIIYISDKANDSNSVLAALQETGYEVVGTDSSTIGAALLYVMRSVAAVVLDNRVTELASFDLAQRLRQIRPNVPVMLLCREQIEEFPFPTNECVNTDKLTFALEHLLIAEPALG
jgi:DNA-binding NarL/FixJ family response regulator